MRTDTKIILAFIGSMLAGLLIATVAVLPPSAATPAIPRRHRRGRPAAREPHGLGRLGTREPHGLGRLGAREPHDLGQSDMPEPGVPAQPAARPGHATRPAA